MALRRVAILCAAVMALALVACDAPGPPERVEGLCPLDHGEYLQGGEPRVEVPPDFAFVAVTWCSRPLPDLPLVERFATDVEPLARIMEELPTKPLPTVSRSGASVEGCLLIDPASQARQVVFLYPADGGAPVMWQIPPNQCDVDRYDVFEVLEYDMTWTWTGDPIPFNGA